MLGGSSKSVGVLDASRAFLRRRIIPMMTKERNPVRATICSIVFKTEVS